METQSTSQIACVDTLTAVSSWNSKTAGVRSIRRPAACRSATGRRFEVTDDDEEDAEEPTASLGTSAQVRDFAATTRVRLILIRIGFLSEWRVAACLLDLLRPLCDLRTLRLCGANRLRCWYRFTSAKAAHSHWWFSRYRGWRTLVNPTTSFEDADGCSALARRGLGGVLRLILHPHSPCIWSGGRSYPAPWAQLLE